MFLNNTLYSLLFQKTLKKICTANKNVQRSPFLFSSSPPFYSSSFIFYSRCRTNWSDIYAPLSPCTHLMLMRYCANATASGFPVMVIVRSVAPPSLSSQLLILIMAPEIWRISAILVPPLPMMHPISSFGTVISCVWLFAAGCCLFVLLVRSWLPASAANAVERSRPY